MAANPDFETLYSNEPGKIRANANLPGQLVLPVNRLTVHAHSMEEFRLAIEKDNPGYDEKHLHSPSCEVLVTVRGIKSVCGKWNWKDWGIPETFNPVKQFVTPYLQLSRSEAMKGSEQVVRSFQGARASDIEGVGLAPDLMPKAERKQPVTTLVVMAQNGATETKRELDRGKSLVGLRGK